MYVHISMQSMNMHTSLKDQVGLPIDRLIDRLGKINRRPKLLVVINHSAQLVKRYIGR